MTKRQWCDMICGLLSNDPRNSVKQITYTDRYEVVEIEYESGYMARINVTANSLGAILREIVAEVYGPGSLGTFWRGFRKKEIEKEEA